MNLPADKSIEKAVERRRSAETARKARIFNTRLRVMGIDTNALSKQVEDKKQRQNMEMQCDKAFGKPITPNAFIIHRTIEENISYPTNNIFSFK